VADAADLVEVRLRTRGQPINKRRECPRAGSIVCLEFAKRCLRASHDKLGQRRGVGAKS
jgi:hypothetical protein